MPANPHSQHSQPQSNEQLVVIYPQLKAIGIPFSNCQLLRKEKAGDFPSRWYMSEKNRAGFVAMSSHG